MKKSPGLDYAESQFVTSFTAERIALHCRCVVTREALRRARVEVETEVCGNLQVSMESYIVGMPAETIKIYRKYPKDWWQAVRERWLPKFWLKRWPVVYKVIDINEQRYKAVCPHINVPDNRPHLTWMAQQ